MSGDNYCNLQVSGSWLFTGVWNNYDSAGAHQCNNYSITISNRTWSSSDYLFFRATDNGEATVSLGYTIYIILKSK